MKTLKSFLSSLLIFSALACGELSAEIYKWVDENGRVHFSDRKAKGQAVEVVPIKVNSLTGAKGVKALFCLSRKMLVIYVRFHD